MEILKYIGIGILVIIAGIIALKLIWKVVNYLLSGWFGYIVAIPLMIFVGGICTEKIDICKEHPFVTILIAFVLAIICSYSFFNDWLTGIYIELSLKLPWVKKDEEWLIKKAYENGQIHIANEEDEDEFVEMKGYQKREKTIDD